MCEIVRGGRNIADRTTNGNHEMQRRQSFAARNGERSRIVRCAPDMLFSSRYRVGSQHGLAARILPKGAHMLSRGCTANSTRSYRFTPCKHGLCISATALLIAAASPGATAQTGAAAAAPQARTAAGPPARRPPLLFKEEWKQNEKGDEHPATQDSVGNPNLELKLYGATGKDLQITGKAGDENNPIHIWSGNCTSPCALALRDKTDFADRAIPRARQEDRHDPQVALAHQPLRTLTQAAEGIVADDEPVGRLEHALGRAILARTRSGGHSGLLLPLHVVCPLGPTQAPGGHSSQRGATVCYCFPATARMVSVYAPRPLFWNEVAVMR